MFWWLFVASTVAAIVAISRKSWRWMVGSAALYLPIAWYFSMTPRFESVAPLLLVPFVLAGIALWCCHRWLAAASLSPILALMAWLGLAVATQA